MCSLSHVLTCALLQVWTIGASASPDGHLLRLRDSTISVKSEVHSARSVCSMYLCVRVQSIHVCANKYTLLCRCGRYARLVIAASSTVAPVASASRSAAALMNALLMTKECCAVGCCVNSCWAEACPHSLRGSQTRALPPNTDVVCVVGLERDLQHGLKFAALLAEQECKVVLRLDAQSAATQCFASHCAYRSEAWKPGCTRPRYIAQTKESTYVAPPRASVSLFPFRSVHYLFLGRGGGILF
jgi:hypothetical protein